MQAPVWMAFLLAISVVVVGCGFEPDTPLTLAAAGGHAGEVEALLANGADVNQEDGAGLTSLVWAARSGQVTTLKALLANGADPELPAGSNGWTPLIHAIHKRQNAAALVLLDAGVEVKSDSGAGALLMAAGYGNAEMVRALLARGANPHARSGGVTVLSNAVGGAWDIDYRWPGCAAHAETVKALLEAAPDLRLEDNFWAARALSYARRKGCTELVTLVEFGSVE